MRSAGRLCALSITPCVVLLAATTHALAAPKRVSGKLSKPGYTVIALAANGTASVASAGRARFRLQPPAKRVTLHLRAATGEYAGPIVIGRAKRGKRAIVGVRAGAKLGRVRVRRGHAKVAKRPRRTAWIDRRRIARAKKGVPIGVGNFGYVRSKPLRGVLRGELDFDGVPDALDIDDDGDLILDDYDRSTRARSAQAGGTFPDGTRVHASTYLPVAGADVVNANAGSSDEQIATTLRSWGTVNVFWIGIDPDSGELDCGGVPDPLDPAGWSGGLPYCTRGGTGRLQELRTGGGEGFVPYSESLPFPGQLGDPNGFDPDGDGFGSFTQADTPPGQTITLPPDFGRMALYHGATAGEIDAGDVLVERATVGGNESQSTTTVGLVFATPSALASYVDETGAETSISYPVVLGGPGTPGNGFPVADGPDGDSDVEVTLTLWRPQRKPIGEPPNREACLDQTPPCEWIDIGNLAHAADVSVEGSSVNCPQSSYSATDGNLTPVSSSPFGEVFPDWGGFRDLAIDGRADPASTLTYTLNVTRCLGSDLDPGQEFTLGLWAVAIDRGDGGIPFTTSFVSFRQQ